jgi:uncharacterized protein (TIGR03437 family)
MVLNGFVSPSPLILIAATVFAQAPSGPVLPPRGVTNAFSATPAPAVSAPGGLIQVEGLNLGPAAEIVPATLPLPVSLGDPAVQVLINNRPAPIISLQATRVLVQIPYETPVGLATVIVRRGEQNSRPARIQIQAAAPSMLAANGRGFGMAANGGTGELMKVRIAGLGLTEPRVESGAVSAEAKPRQTVRVYVGGLPAVPAVSASAGRPGEFEAEFALPAGAAPGDPVQVLAGNLESNLLVTPSDTRTSVMRYVAYPAGTPDLRSLRSADLRGLYLTANAARAANSCFASYVVDMAASRMTPVDGCPATAQAQALTPFVEAPGSPSIAAFEGPFTGTATPGQPTPISDKVRLFHPSLPAPLTATLPAAAANLTGAEGGNFIANVPGTPARQYLIRTLTGEVEDFVPANPGAGGGAVNPQQLIQRFQNLDLGDGVNRLLSNVSVLGNQILLTAGDGVENLTKAKVAVLNAQGEILSAREFPAGWLPLAAPAPPQQPNAPPNPGLAAVRLPTPSILDAQSRTYYVPSRTADGKHGFAVFPVDGDPRMIELPADWTVTSCTANIAVFALELDRSVALLGSRTEERAFRNPCQADGFLLFDLNARTFEAIALPGSGRFNATGGAEEINDFLTGANVDPANRSTSDTLYALDGVNSTVFRFDLPAGVNNFSGGTRVPALNLLVAQANNRVAGDAGIVIFDLEKAEARLLPTPEGFAAANAIGILPSLRKVVARGIRTNAAGAQILVYDLISGDVEIVANPEGVAWLGSPPAQGPAPGMPPMPGQQTPQIPVRVNAKANTLEAIAFGEDRRQRGIAVIQIR